MRGAEPLLRQAFQGLIQSLIPCGLQRSVLAPSWSAAPLGSGSVTAARALCTSASTHSAASAQPATSNRGGEASTASGSGGCGDGGSSSSSGEDAVGGGTSGVATASAGGAPPGSPLPGSKRFYKTVHVERAPGQDGWQLLLDKYPVRTPARNPVVLPTYPLALALAAEWEWLPAGKPILHAMPLMSLVATAIDQPKPRSRVLDDLLKYAHTDAACVRYEPGTLAQRQAKAFDPLLAWAADELGWRMAASDDICGPTQDAATIAAVRAYLDGLDSWHLAAAEQLTAACKSVVLAAALLRARVGPQEALEAARLEEAFQIEDWGMVEAGHDLDAADLTTRVIAPAVMVALLGRGGGGGDGGGGSGGGGGSNRQG